MDACRLRSHVLLHQRLPIQHAMMNALCLAGGKLGLPCTCMQGFRLLRSMELWLHNRI